MKDSKPRKVKRATGLYGIDKFFVFAHEEKYNLVNWGSIYIGIHQLSAPSNAFS